MNAKYRQMVRYVESLGLKSYGFNRYYCFKQSYR